MAGHQLNSGAGAMRAIARRQPIILFLFRLALPGCRSPGLAAAGLLALSCVSALAQQDFPEGTWAVGNRNACWTKPYELRIARDVWQFTDNRHAVNTEKVLSASGRKYLTETISSPDVPRGTRWTYTFTSDAVGLVSNSLGTSFTIVRCADLQADCTIVPIRAASGHRNRR